VDLWAADLDDPIEAPGDLLSDDEHARAARFSQDVDRVRFLAGKAHLRRLLGGYLSIPPGDVPLQCSQAGKPYLAGRDFDFSVSHSEHLLVIGVGVPALGVDVELVRSIPDMEPVAELVFTGRELDALAAAAPEERLTCFYRLWTAKEALLKGLGLGLSRDPREVELHPTPDGFVVPASPESADGWRVASLHLACPPARGGAIAAVATHHPRRPHRP
jgi:4'-phosphopantetheinyl transferase